jgi:cytochrome c
MSPRSGPAVPPGSVAPIVGVFFAPTDAVALDIIAAQSLARQSGCPQCHQIYQKKVGPAWKDVAAKYHADPDAEHRLYVHVTTGRKPRFDDGHEESHPVVKTRDPDRIGNLVNWILSLK